MAREKSIFRAISVFEAVLQGIDETGIDIPSVQCAVF
jgi:hypothetical protein